MLSESEPTESQGSQPLGVTLRGSLRSAMNPAPTVYEVVGGQQFFDDLVDLFYDGVEHDPRLRPMYPTDLGPSRERLAGFLAQYWGGPPLYSQERGHPQLRMRHMPFTIGQTERDAWMAHMTAALRQVRIVGASGAFLPAGIAAQMLEYFENAATHLINHPPGR